MSAAAPEAARVAGRGGGVKPPPRELRVLVVADDNTAGSWLQLRLQASYADARITVLDSIGMQKQVRHPRRRDR